MCAVGAGVVTIERGCKNVRRGCLENSLGPVNGRPGMLDKGVWT